MSYILIVDDERPMLNLMAKACEQMGHRVKQVQSGKEALMRMQTD